MNRLAKFLADQPEPERPDDFFDIQCRLDSFSVSRQTALSIERRLDHRPPPRWITFRDLTGARHRVMASHVLRISESTAAQRAAAREFNRARRLENKTERPWDDDIFW
jgi:hypothetical protein